MSARALLQIARELREAVEQLIFSDPVERVYNPLRYAWAPFTTYVERYGDSAKSVVLIGMNPGPWGMAQTGVPFGEVAAVRDWLGIHEPVGKPDAEHPKRPVEGFDCSRSEVSGERLWGWARRRFGTPDRFFDRFFVANYCPLVFMEASARNRTPDKLPAAERKPLFDACDRALRATVEALGPPDWVIGIGAFAEGRAYAALEGLDVQIGRILHPSPASPLANRGWAQHAEAQLEDLGIALPE